jgi:hypothetical protein
VILKCGCPHIGKSINFQPNHLKFFTERTLRLALSYLNIYYNIYKAQNFKNNLYNRSNKKSKKSQESFFINFFKKNAWFVFKIYVFMGMQSIFKLLKLKFIHNSCNNKRKLLIKFEINKKNLFFAIIL